MSFSNSRLNTNSLNQNIEVLHEKKREHRRIVMDIVNSALIHTLIFRIPIWENVIDYRYIYDSCFKMFIV
jgi:hypothetical protein